MEKNCYSSQCTVTVVRVHFLFNKPTISFGKDYIPTHSDFQTASAYLVKPQPPFGSLACNTIWSGWPLSLPPPLNADVTQGLDPLSKVKQFIKEEDMFTVC